MTTRTLPNYQEMAERIYSLIVNQEVGHLVGRAEIQHALQHAQQVGETLGFEKGFDSCRLKLQKEYL